MIRMQILFFEDQEIPNNERDDQDQRAVDGVSETMDQRGIW